ncbi:LysR family transcriptional regulator [Cryptosporangium arvum]|uniref:Transcriptional regulator n=1 Tax=Cryptosporangium arvum DSM 44712 TaxID=927661 RepID=A0A010ZRF8_9ACTN|nr:LysR family transcriptional regulator [Cryptosporangium arvum]EXG81224.1 transcriptional regulator [Cryptosporangium arvum DSM 44712]
MDLRHLRSFATVARTGSFTAAAAELGFTQSAISQHVAALEADLGRRLLHRRPVRLTEAGTRLLTHAQHLLLRADVARQEILRRNAHRPATIAVTPLAAGDRLLGALGLVDLVEVVLGSADEAVSRLAAGTVDAAAVDGVTAPNGPLGVTEPGVLTRALIAETRLEVLLTADHPLATAGGVDLDSVRDARWIDAPDLRCDVPGAAAPTTTGRLRYRGTDLSLLARLVARGHGLALLPSGLAPETAGVARVPLVRPDVVHRTELLVPRGRADQLSALLAGVVAGEFTENLHE